MLALLSPAKSLDLSPPPAGIEASEPALLPESVRLAKVARRLTEAEVGRLMEISPKLAALTCGRFRAFRTPFDATNAWPAALVFDGAVYRGLDARTLPPAALTWAQDRLGILSGLYGLLRPLDLIQPYRLEMGTRLANPRGADLYAFWGGTIAEQIDATVAGHTDPTVVNLASAEYFKAVGVKRLRAPLVTCIFEEWRESPADGRVLAVYAKRARGLMARHLIEGRVERVEGLKEFTTEGYRYHPDRSTDDRWVFARKQPVKRR